MMLPKGFHFFERGWLSSNSVLIQDADQSVLFDTGYVTHSAQLLNLLGKVLTSRTLDTVINTHLHSDHCGGNHLLQTTFPQLQVLIPETQFHDVLAWSSLTYEQTGQSCPRFHPSTGVKSTAVLGFCDTEWQAMSSPGHDNDSLIFFEPHHQILITADALWENGLSVVFPEFLGGIGFDHVAQTYDLIESLKPNLVIPGHGPMFTNVAKAISDGRRKLTTFLMSPHKHAIYSAKVLIKFKLMECHKVKYSDFSLWCRNSPLLMHIHNQFFLRRSIQSWIENLILELADRRALLISDGYLVNL